MSDTLNFIIVIIAVIMAFFISLSFVFIVNGQQNYTFQNIESFTQQLVNDCSILQNTQNYAKSNGLMGALQFAYSNVNDTSKYYDLCAVIMDSIDKICKDNVTKFRFC